jgi:hypothetical protein
VGVFPEMCLSASNGAFDMEFINGAFHSVSVNSVIPKPHSSQPWGSVKASRLNLYNGGFQCK